MPLAFDGSADYIHWDASHIPEGNGLTFGAWCFPDVINGTFRRALHFRDANIGFKFVFVNESGTNRAYVVTGNAANIGNSLRATTSAGAWRHLIGTKTTSHTLASAYLNGVLMTDTGGGTFANGTDNDRLTIGARSDASLFFDGVVAHVVVWDSWEPTAAEALALSLGANPLRVGPTPIHYAPIPGLYSQEPDLISRKLATHVSAPPFRDAWAPIRFYSFPALFVGPAAAAGAEMAAQASLVVSANAILSTAIEMAAQASATVTTAATLTTAIELLAAASLVATAQGALTTAIEMAGSASLLITTVAELEGGGALLEASAPLAVQAAGALTTEILMTAAATLAVVAIAELTAPGSGGPSAPTPYVPISRRRRRHG